MARAPCAESRPDALTLEELILRGRSGDRQAVKRLIERYQGRIAKLSHADRSVQLLNLDEKRSYQELARLSNTTVSAVNSRLYRARRELRDLLVAGGPK